MAHSKNARGALAAEADMITRGQMVFALVGVGIIFGGLWTISESDAPYHPKIPAPVPVQTVVLAGGG